MNLENKQEKFNASIDNLRNILDIKRNCQQNLLDQKYDQVAEILTIWGFEIIAWKSKQKDTDAKSKLEDFRKSYNRLSKEGRSVVGLKQEIILEWYESVMNYSYEIWFSKLEDNPFDGMEI